MSDPDGQAAARIPTPAPAPIPPRLRRRAIAGGRWAVRIAAGALGLLGVAAGGIAVRLASLPLEITGLVRQFAPRQLSLTRATAWWNWREAGSPLELALENAVLARPDGSIEATARHITVGVLPGRLLIGRIRPVEIEAAQASLALRRQPGGAIQLDNGRPPAAAPPAPRQPARVWLYLRAVRLTDVSVTLTDRASATVWRAAIATLTAGNLDTAAQAGTADVTVQAHGQTARLTATLTATPHAAGGARQLTGAFSAIDPAQLDLPLPASQALDLPVAGSFRLAMATDWTPRAAVASLALGAGQIRAAGGATPVAGGAAQLQANLLTRQATLTAARLSLAGPPASPEAPTVTATGTLHWAAGRQTAALVLDADRVGFAGLARYWPPLAARDPRAWVIANITQGTASKAHLELGLAVAHGAATLTRATGHLQGEDLTMAWLRPVPPLTHLNATLTLQSPDAIAIAIPTATQAPSDPASPPLLLGNASLRITGLTGAVQTGTIEADLAGPVAQTIALLSEPRLHLLARHPLNFGIPAGALAAHLRVQLPLDAQVTMDQIAIHANGGLTDLHLGSVIAGKDLDHGQISLLADNNGLSLDGPAELAGIASALSVHMDFRAGPPDQTIASYAAHGSATAAQLHAAGIPAGALVDGSIGYAATVLERRDGTGQAQAHIDLHAAGLAIAPLGWRKPADTDTTADASVQLLHDQITAVDHLAIRGPTANVQGRATYAAGQPVALVFDRIDLGQTRAAGAIRFPTATDPAIHAELHGDMLDLSLRQQPAGAAPPLSHAQAQAAARARHTAAAHAQTPRGRPWKADLRFAQVLLGPGHALANVAAHAENDGLLVQRAQITGQAGQAGFRITLSPQGASRRLHAEAKDAGGLLQALDLTGAVHGGALQVDAAYDDTQPDHPLTGTLSAGGIRIVHAPAVARLLQAVTLYGLVDVLRGPGLGITHLVAPFRYADSVLTLDNARAFSSSLGITAQGEIDLAAQRADLTGTIVPGYFFNTLPGKLPVLGKLFSPEKGGGVFSGTYKLSGPLADAKVQVNPLAALTPGFLRGLFGSPSQPPPPAH